MPNRILALDLHGPLLVAVTVETSFRGYQIVGHGTEPRDASRPLAEQVRALVARHPGPPDLVLSALPGNAAAYRILDLPFKDRRKLEQTVPFELESQLPFAVEDAVVDFQILAKTGDGTRVFAALAPRSRIEDHLKTLAEAGLDPAVVDFAPLTTLNVLQLFEGERPARYAFLHLSATQGTLALYRGGVLAHLRVIDVGEPAGLARDVGWSLKSFNGGPPMVTGDVGEPAPLLIGGAAPPELLEAFRHDESVVVQRLEDLPLRQVPAALHGRQGTYAPALGLALREIADGPTLGLNFRRDRFAYSRGRDEIRTVATRLGLLGAIVLVLFLVSQVVSYVRLRGEYRDVSGLVRQAFEKTLPGQPIVDETQQLKQEIERLKKQQQQFGFPQGGPVSVLEVLKQISERAPAEPRMNVDELSIDSDGVHLRAKTASFEAVETVRKKIAESPLFQDVAVKDPRTVADGSVEFRMNLTLGPKGGD